MQRSHFKRDFTTTFIGVLVLLLGATLGFGQQQVNLTAAPTTATLPDGSSVPMATSYMPRRVRSMILSCCCS